MFTTIGLTMALAATGPGIAAPAQQVKFASIWEQPADNAALDDWYRRTHSREARQSVGQWLTGYVAFRGYDVPAQADAFNVVRYRLTEMSYASAAAAAEAQTAWQPLSPPPIDKAGFPDKTRIATIWVPVVPTEKYLPAFPKARATYLRWVFFMRYPPGVSLEAGEAWFTKVHAPEIAKTPGVRRFVCAKTIHPIKVASDWVRMCDVWFDDYAAWQAASATEPSRVTPPPWAKARPYLEYISIFTAPHPDMDFLHDGYRVP